MNRNIYFLFVQNYNEDFLVYTKESERYPGLPRGMFSGCSFALIGSRNEYFILTNWWAVYLKKISHIHIC